MVKNWMEQYRSLKDRYETMSKALELLDISKGTNIVETGTLRQKDDWGAGMSTLIFGAYCKEFGRHLTTVDLSPQNMEVCKEVTEPYKEFIDYIVSDSVLFLKLYDKKIDLLYLDSVDCPIEVHTDQDQKELEFAQNHQLNEIKEALLKMNDTGIVLLDDNWFEHGGKTALSKQYLKEQGWKEIASHQQSLWIK